MKAHYARHLDDFAKTKVEFPGESCNADSSEVRIVVVRPNDRIPVNFRLLQKPRDWMIYDMVIEGVSMVNNFRTQFSHAMSLSSYQGLLGSPQGPSESGVQGLTMGKKLPFEAPSMAKHGKRLQLS